MNNTLGLTVTGQHIKITEPVMLVSGTVNIYTAVFSFDAEWDDYVKTAVFRCGGVEKETSLSGNSCQVPWEVLTADGRLSVGVYGTKGSIRFPTIWTERTIRIKHGAGPTDEAAEPSPTLVEQLLTKVGNLDSLKTEDKSSVVAAINEVWASGGGGSGASVTDAAINEDGHLIITLSTGKQIDAGYAVGPAGPAGAAGKDGKDGAPGKDGADGQPGADGVGIQSVVQTTTSTEDGGTNIITVTKTDGTSSAFAVRNGSRGSTGPAGADGKDGTNGKDGADGAAGPAGADGKSAYQYAQEGGYTGTEAEFAAKLAQEKFANPNALTFTGAVTGSYDGSAPVSVEIPSGGGGSGDIIDVLMDATIEEAVAAVTVTLDTPRAYKELYIATCIYGDESNSAANAMFLRVNNTDTMNSKNVIAWIPNVENATSATAKSYGVAFVKLLDDCSFYYCYGSKSSNARTPNLSFGERDTGFNRESIISTLKFQSVNQWTKFGVGSTIKVYGVRS